MSAMEESLKNLRKELEAVEQEENKLRGQEVDIKHEMDKYESVMKDNQNKEKHWQKEVCWVHVDLLYNTDQHLFPADI